MTSVEIVGSLLYQEPILRIYLAYVHAVIYFFAFYNKTLFLSKFAIQVSIRDLLLTLSIFSITNLLYPAIDVEIHYSLVRLLCV